MPSTFDESEKPPAPDHLLRLAQVGFYQYTVLPETCPCPMHDEGGGDIQLGIPVVRSGASGDWKGISWHDGRVQQNASHAITGLRTFGPYPVDPERCEEALQGPWQMGSFQLPGDLSLGATCAFTGESVFGFTSEDKAFAEGDKATWLGRLKQGDFRQRLDTDQCAWPLDEGGHSFLARHNEDGSLTLLQSTCAAADWALSTYANLSQRNVHPDWKVYVGSENDLVIDLFKPYGPAFVFSQEDVKTSPRHWNRQSMAWRHFLEGYTIDEVCYGMVEHEQEPSPWIQVLPWKAGQELTVESVRSSIQDIISLCKPIIIA